MAEMLSMVQLNQEAEKRTKKEEQDCARILIAEQDRAYQESLEADRLKAYARKAEAKARIKEEKEQLRIQQEEEEKERKWELEKAAIREAVKVAEEPSEDCSELITTICKCCPEGNSERHRCLATQPVQELLSYLISKGYHTLGDYRVFTSFPRRDLTELDSEKTFQELGIFPQETVMHLIARLDAHFPLM